MTEPAELTERVEMTELAVMVELTVMVKFVGGEGCPVAKAAWSRCKNLRTGSFAKTAMQAIQWHIFRNRLFLDRLKNIDLRTCANCKQLTVRYLQKHPVLRFLHDNHTGRKPGTPYFRQTWQSGRLGNTADRNTADLEVQQT